VCQDWRNHCINYCPVPINKLIDWQPTNYYNCRHKCRGPGGSASHNGRVLGRRRERIQPISLDRKPRLGQGAVFYALRCRAEELYWHAIRKCSRFDQITTTIIHTFLFKRDSPSCGSYRLSKSISPKDTFQTSRKFD
jgi:hypothetical protein